MSIETFELDTTKTYSGLPAPDHWHIVEPWGNGIKWERLIGERITIIEDITVKADGKRWLHVSVGRPKNKMPTLGDLYTARKLFIGEDRECYFVFPTKERYVNIGNVLHLWSCLDEPDGVLPHFEGMVNLGGVTVMSV